VSLDQSLLYIIPQADHLRWLRLLSACTASALLLLPKLGSSTLPTSTWSYQKLASCHLFSREELIGQHARVFLKGRQLGTPTRTWQHPPNVQRAHTGNSNLLKMHIHPFHLIEYTRQNARAHICTYTKYGDWTTCNCAQAYLQNLDLRWIWKICFHRYWKWSLDGSTKSRSAGSCSLHDLTPMAFTKPFSRCTSILL